ncbi:unnamed protein product [Moneuplotes crassus]|uniref:Uncharacterized protein n=2 Tax=Euplotes crassus TaxID=5936 RepID=A0AAD2D3C1_EUPCR|nr:unnamed protein product [Moneuplotes crassus]
MEIFSLAIKRARFNYGRLLKELGLQFDRKGCKLSYNIAPYQELSRHQTVHPLYGHTAHIRNAWIAPNAHLLGRVVVSPWATIWYNAVLRAEINTIRIGHFSSIGDATVINSSISTPVNVPPSVNIGKNVIIGDNCSINSCIIDDEVKIGNRSYIGEGVVIERGAEIEANSIIPPGSLIPAGQLWGGNTVKYIRDLTQEEKWNNYNESYTQTVQSQSDEGSSWPSSYIEDISEKEGAETIEEYTERNYFRKGLFN